MCEEFLNQIDHLVHERPRTEGVLQAFRELVVLASESPCEYKAPHVREQEQEEVRKRQMRCLPLFVRDSLPVDLAAASVLFQRFLQHLGRTNRTDRQGLIWALEKAKRDPLWMKEVLQTILNGDRSALEERANQAGLLPPVLLFPGTLALKPGLYALRRAFSKALNLETWGRGHCPFCGTLPAMSCLTREGQRILHCGLCGQEWPFPRLQCPFCHSRDGDSLGYFEAQGEEGFRVDYCRNCMGYLKTVDRRSFDRDTPLELEDLVTVHLDLMAASQGWTRPAHPSG